LTRFSALCPRVVGAQGFHDLSHCSLERCHSGSYFPS
jgi:hypothetical protein